MRTKDLAAVCNLGDVVPTVYRRVDEHGEAADVDTPLHGEARRSWRPGAARPPPGEAAAPPRTTRSSTSTATSTAASISASVAVAATASPAALEPALDYYKRFFNAKPEQAAVRCPACGAARSSALMRVCGGRGHDCGVLVLIWHAFKYFYFQS